MLNGDNELRDAMPLSPCTIEDITVDNQFNKSVLNVKAEMQVSPYGRINIVNGYIYQHLKITYTTNFRR